MEEKAIQYTCSACLFCVTLLLFACRSDENQATTNHNAGSICTILAHPDDETIMGGTLAMLASRGFDITAVYVTSGDDGPDETGRGLHGNALAEVREEEALSALQAVGIEIPPVFLRYPDGHVHEYVDSVQETLDALLDEINPIIVISFGPDGITGDWDHKSAGLATDLAFDQYDSGRLLLHVAVTKPLSPFYAHGQAVPRNTVDVRVRVSKYSRQRVQAVESHKTQFNSRVRSSYKMYVHTMRMEKFIIACNRDADDWLEEYFQK